MNIKNIAEEVDKADASEGRTLLINDYVSSDGTTKDMVVKLLQPGGYLALVAESLRDMQSNRDNILASVMAEIADLTVTAFDTAFDEQQDSFMKSLNDDNSKTAFNIKVPLSPYGRSLVETRELEEGNITRLTVKNLMCMAAANSTAEPGAKEPKGIIPRIKHKIRGMLPVSKYIAQLVFTAGKVGMVKAAPTKTHLIMHARTTG